MRRSSRSNSRLFHVERPLTIFRRSEGLQARGSRSNRWSQAARACFTWNLPSLTPPRALRRDAHSTRPPFPGLPRLDQDRDRRGAKGTGLEAFEAELGKTLCRPAPLSRNLVGNFTDHSVATNCEQWRRTLGDDRGGAKGTRHDQAVPPAVVRIASQGFRSRDQYRDPTLELENPAGLIEGLTAAHGAVNQQAVGLGPFQRKHQSRKSGARPEIKKVASKRGRGRSEVEGVIEMGLNITGSQEPACLGPLEGRFEVGAAHGHETVRTLAPFRPCE